MNALDHSAIQPLSTHLSIPRPQHSWWGRKVLRLPNHGTLLVSTDLHGNMADYQMMKELYIAEENAGNSPFLLFCGDMVHGPNPLLNEPNRWPEYLGSPYRDESARLILDYYEFSKKARTCCLMGNHEHSHVGGPRLSKFHDDEAQVLEDALGSKRDLICNFLRRFPLIAISPCGAVFTHAAPAATEPDLDSFETLSYDPGDAEAAMFYYTPNTVGTLLWARRASDEQARDLLNATAPKGQKHNFVIHGHEIVEQGFRINSPHQLCLSTSYGVHNRNKLYLKLDLAKHYPDLASLKFGNEIHHLHPAS